MVDARLPDGSRVNAVIPPLALDGSLLTIRKFSTDPYTYEDLINFGSLSRATADFLNACVQGRLNILVSGGTGAGKTTTLNVLSSFIPEEERIITIEDSAELQLHQEHVLRLESRPPNIEGRGEVKIRDLVRNSLRMRPDRIVVGEVRDAAALDMLQAMNTGHDGSICTVHANAPRDSLARIETMVLMAGVDLPMRAIREQVSSALDLIVHQTRFKDGSRRITHVTEVVGMEGDTITLQDIFKFDHGMGFDENGRSLGVLKSTGLRPKFLNQLVRPRRAGRPGALRVRTVHAAMTRRLSRGVGAAAVAVAALLAGRDAPPLGRHRRGDRQHVRRPGGRAVGPVRLRRRRQRAGRPRLGDGHRRWSADRCIRCPDHRRHDGREGVPLGHARGRHQRKHDPERPASMALEAGRSGLHQRGSSGPGDRARHVRQRAKLVQSQTTDHARVVERGQRAGCQAQRKHGDLRRRGYWPYSSLGATGTRSIVLLTDGVPEGGNATVGPSRRSPRGLQGPAGRRSVPDSGWTRRRSSGSPMRARARSSRAPARPN